MTKVRSVAAGGDAAVGAVSSSLLSISMKLLIDSDSLLLEDIRRALGVSQFSANRIAKRLIAEGRLKSEGSKRGRRYVSVS